MDRIKGGKADKELAKFKEFCDKHAFVIYEKAELQDQCASFREINIWAHVPDMTAFYITTNLGTKIEILGPMGKRSIYLTNEKENTNNRS